MPRKRGKPVELAAWLEEERPREIGEQEWAVLLDVLAPISESYLRKLLRKTGVPLTPMIEGVKQESFEKLEASLLSLLGEYERGDRPRQTEVRRLVIVAREHARWASRNEEKSLEKREMMLWMLTWLENPPLFPAWVLLRRAATGNP